MDFDSFELTPTDHALMGEYLPENLDLSENTDLQTKTEKDGEENSHDADDLDSLFGPEVDDESEHGNFEDSTPATAFTPSPLPFEAAQLRGEVVTSRGALPVKPVVVEQSLTTGASGTDAKPPTLCLPTGKPVRGHTDRKSPSPASKHTAPRLALPSRSARKPSPSPAAIVPIAAPETSSLRPSLPIVSARSSTPGVERELSRARVTSFAASAASTPATATLTTSPAAARRVAAAEAQAVRNGSHIQSVLQPASPRAQRAPPPSTQAAPRAVAPAASSHPQAQRFSQGPSASSAAFATSGLPSGMTPRIPSVLLPAPQAMHSRDTSERATPAASSTAQSRKRKRNANANTAAPAAKRQVVTRGPPSSVASHPSMAQHLHRATSGAVAGPSRLSSIPTVPSNAPAPRHEPHSTIAARGFPVTAPVQSSSTSLVSPRSYSMARTRVQIPQPAENIPITTTSAVREPTAAEVAKAHTRVPEPPLRLPLQNRWGFYYPEE